MSLEGNVIGSLELSSSSSRSLCTVGGGGAADLLNAGFEGCCVFDDDGHGGILSSSTGGVPLRPLMRTLFCKRGDRLESSGSASGVGIRPVTP